jgi:hypothetical protein
MILYLVRSTDHARQICQNRTLSHTGAGPVAGARTRVEPRTKSLARFPMRNEGGTLGQSPIPFVETVAPAAEREGSRRILVRWVGTIWAQLGTISGPRPVIGCTAWQEPDTTR